jgi:exopolysaccharide production protein ExoQ
MAFIAVLFVRDLRLRYRTTAAIWIPTAWMLITGSRFVSEWLNPGARGTAGDQLDGSPIDRVVFLGLIVGGAAVLWRRRLKVVAVLREHGWLVLFLVYSLIAVTWSDYPFVSLKRWIKILGHPIMALVIFTEPEPKASLHRVLMRVSFVLIPMSITLMKYFPALGRAFEYWSGASMNTGVTKNKNELGYVCMILGLYLVWHLKAQWTLRRVASERRDVLAALTLLAMACYLMQVANSKTSLVGLVVGTVAMFASTIVPGKLMGPSVIAIGGAYYLLDRTFGVYASIVRMLSRRPDLTDRTDLWTAVMEVPINPLLGAGFESFWLGDRLVQMWIMFPFRPNQAHNGYIETYLNLGLIGVALLVVLLIATFRKARQFVVVDPLFTQYRLGLLAAIVLYNYTEAAFKAVHFVFFAFYLTAIDYSVVQAALPHRAAAPTQPGGVPDPRTKTKPRRVFTLAPRFGGTTVPQRAAAVAVPPAAVRPQTAAARFGAAAASRWILRSSARHSK